MIGDCVLTFTLHSLKPVSYLSVRYMNYHLINVRPWSFPFYTTLHSQRFKALVINGVIFNNVFTALNLLNNPKNTFRIGSNLCGQHKHHHQNKDSLPHICLFLNSDYSTEQQKCMCSLITYFQIVIDWPRTSRTSPETDLGYLDGRASSCLPLRNARQPTHIHSITV